MNHLMKVLVVLLVLMLGCARVKLETSKPIKVDINLRVDVYQHVVKDVDTIADEIYGSQGKKMNAIFSLEEVYAADFSEEATQAISRRKERLDKIDEYFSKGYIGEERNALLVIRDQTVASQIESTINEENKDRQLIYKATAEKNQAEASEVAKVFFNKDYERAQSGWWFEVFDSERGRYLWQRK